MVKHCFDFILASILLILCSPVMVTLAMLVRLKMGKPVLFRQLRPGLFGRPFYLYKFRTMTDQVDEAGNLLDDDKRLTVFGKKLRRYSLDEIPQLLNILKGELSFVGPRPLLMDYLDRYNSEQARRHAVKPGITGWAQVNGRNAISWEEKFKLDVWYVDNRSFWLDMKILWLTLLKVLRTEGISGEGSVTMTKFMGSGNGEDDG